MSDGRDPRVAEFVTRLIEQAPPAPAFPDDIVQRGSRRRRVAVVGGVVAAVVALSVALALVFRPSGRSVVVSIPPSTTVPVAAPALVRPSALAVRPDGLLYVSDPDAHRVVAVTPNGAVRVVAHIGQPNGLALDDGGSLYVADDGMNTVRRIAPDGTVTTFAGDGTAGFDGDGGPATKAKLADPWALAFGPDRALYISDSGNGRVRRVASDGTITTVAGNGASGDTGNGGPAVDAGLDPQALAFDGDGNLDVFHFAGKVVRRISPNGIISSLPNPLYASGFATTPVGDVAVADYGGFGISRISRDGAVSTLPFQHSGLFRPVAIAVRANGDVYVADDGASSGGPMRILLVHLDGASVDVTPRGRVVDSSSDCPGPVRTFPRFGQDVVPVQVPCYCPTQPMTPGPSSDNPEDEAVRAATAWLNRIRQWDSTATRVEAVYKVGDTSNGQFGRVFASAVATYCGNSVAAASYGVELVNPTNNSGSQGDVVVAHFANGWQVWGSYHP